MRPLVYLQLTQDAGHFWIDGESGPAAELGEVRLSPEATVAIPALDPPHLPSDYSLDALVQALVEFKQQDLELAFSERGQMAIGKYLYDQTLAKLPAVDSLPKADLRIITGDEHVGRLPWALLARDATFLIVRDWTVSMANGERNLPNVELVPPVRMLVVAPEPKSLEATQRDQHLTDIEQLFRRCSPAMADAEHLQHARTWDEFREKVASNQFDIIYYYGHGRGNVRESRLVFEDADGSEHECAAADFADEVRLSHGTPKIIYVNCCQGDAGGLLGIGRQLSELAPCVVTNRTVALVRAAAAQALTFWEQVLLDGQPPHLAGSRNYQRLGDIGLSRIRPHWFTPVVYANYRQFLSHPPRQKNRKGYDPDWKVKLDRRDQFAIVSHDTREMVDHRKPRTLAYLWYGEKDQGVHHFHERLELELPRALTEAGLVARRPRWPEYDPTEATEVSYRAFEEKLWEAFDVESLELIGGRVREQSLDSAAVVLLNFPHVTDSKTMSLERLPKYLAWWDECVLPRLEDERHFYVLAFSFRVQDVIEAEKAIADFGFADIRLKNVVPETLPPLGCISRSDLVKFFQRNKVQILEAELDHILDHVMKRTGGRLEPTLKEIEDAVIKGYAELPELVQEQPVVEKPRFSIG